MFYGAAAFLIAITISMQSFTIQKALCVPFTQKFRRENAVGELGSNLQFRDPMATEVIIVPGELQLQQQRPHFY